MRVITLITIIFISSNLFAQNSTDAVLFGTIKNNKSKGIQLAFRNNPIDTLLYNIEINLNEKGQFYEVLPIKKAISGRLIIEKDTFNVFIEPAESIEIIYTNRSIDFKSKFANNNFLFLNEKKYFNEIKKINSNITKYDFYKYSNEIDTITNNALRDLKEFSLSNTLSPSFIKYQKAKFIYNSSNRKYDFLNKYDLLETKYENKPENEVYLFFDKLSVNQPDFLLMNEYIEFLLKRHKYKYYQSNLTNLNEQEQMSLKFKLVTEMYEGRELYFVLTKVLAEILEDHSYLYAKSLIPEYMSTVSIQEYRSFIDRKIQLAIRRLE